MKPCQSCNHALHNGDESCPKCGHIQNILIAPNTTQRTAPDDTEQGDAPYLLTLAMLLSPSILCAIIGHMLFGLKGMIAGIFIGLIFYLLIDGA